jgi:hypothetical protein
VQRIVAEAYERTLATVRQHKEEVEALALKLIEVRCLLVVSDTVYFRWKR